MSRNVTFSNPVKHETLCNCSPLTAVKLREGEKGHFTHPVLIVPLPCTFQDDDDCNCAGKLKKHYSMRGIPDPWNDCLLVKKAIENDSLYSNGKEWNITKCLGENYRLDFGQGIPDPREKWIRLEPAKEPLGNFKIDMKNYFENVKMKLDAGICKTDNIICPSCKRQLVVFCLNKVCRRRRREEEKKVESKIDKSSEDAVGIGKIEVEIPDEGVYLKDACVETDELREEVKATETAKLKEYENYDCSRVQTSTCMCNTSKRESKPKIYKAKEDHDSSDSGCFCGRRRYSCKKLNDASIPVCIHNFPPFLPGVPMIEQFRLRSFSTQEYANIANEIPSSGKDQYVFSPTSVLPNACPSISITQPEHIWWLPRSYFRGERNGHFFELKWVCQKCERRKKKNQRGKSKSVRRDNSIRRDCKTHQYSEMKRMSELSFRSEDNDVNSDSCGIYKISRLRHSKFQERGSSERPRCHCDGSTSKGRNIVPKGKSHESDFKQLLQILGCTELYRNKRNTNYHEPLVNQNSASKSMLRDTQSYV